MNENRFWTLMAKKKAGEASPEEQVELNQISVDHSIPEEVIRKMDVVWNATFHLESDVQDSSLADAFEHVQAKIAGETGAEPPVRSRSWRVRLMAVTAAAILAGLIITAYIRFQAVPAVDKRNTVSTRNGSRSNLELPDGTKVWLNAGSEIIYNESYGKTNRDVQLIGEAYFDVTRNANMPFIIQTREIIVKVLGTVFNVKAYPSDKITEATLLKGSIEVSFPGRPNDKLILRPSQKITLKNTGETFDIKPKAVSTSEIPYMTISKLSYLELDSTVIETSWIQNKFIFKNKPFSELADEMERWFNVRIIIEDTQLQEEKFTGSFNSGRSVQDALEALQLSYPFKFSFDKSDSIIRISMNK